VVVDRDLPDMISSIVPIALFVSLPSWRPTTRQFYAEIKEPEHLVIMSFRIFNSLTEFGRQSVDCTDSGSN
jgi:hypothetical protein